MGEDTGFDWVTPTQMVKLAKEASRAARWSERRPILVAIFKGLLQWVAFVGLLFGIGALFVLWDRGLTRETLFALSAGFLSILIIGLSHRRVRSWLPSPQFPTVRVTLPPIPKVQWSQLNWPRLNRQTLANLKRPNFQRPDINWSAMGSGFKALGRRVAGLGRASMRAAGWIRNHMRALSLPRFNWKAVGSGALALCLLLLFFGFDGWSKTASWMSALSGVKEIEGKARVVDGQSLRISKYRVQLKDIDAPEINQRCRTSRGRSWRCGRQSATVLRKLIGRSSVTCRGREGLTAESLVADCSVGEKHLNLEMVRRGYAWAQESGSSKILEGQEIAKSKSTGIWRGKAETPWDYRAKIWKAAERRAPQGCPIKGNKNSKGQIYYMPWSPGYSRIRIRTRQGERWFCSEEQAVKAGWRAAS